MHHHWRIGAVIAPQFKAVAAIRGAEKEPVGTASHDLQRRRIRYRCHINGHRCSIAVFGTVIGLVGERICAGEIGLGRVGERAVRAQVQCSVLNVINEHRRQ